ncbi:MAG: adenylosuccinate lyase [Pseudobacteriovorax sp.]|nr:adenylosuccinate lyase [Pseudobacteriovorax sp.]
MITEDAKLLAVGAVDGRYYPKTKQLAAYWSESALISYRIKVEAAWLLHLASTEVIAQDIGLKNETRAKLEELYRNPSSESFKTVKSIEATTNHDVKAVEYYIRDELKASGASDKVLAFIHFACTSEDINNLSYSLMLRDYRNEVLLPQWRKILDSLDKMANEHAETPILSRTHGQTATPSTLGKEVYVFSHRLERQWQQLKNLPLLGKINGAVGNYNAHLSAYPNIDWPQLAKEFIEDRLGLVQNPITTQIENHDAMIEYCDIVKRFNTIAIGLARDFWSYISIGYFTQVTKAGEVGSSTMPHKVNPIDFENAEGNFGISNGLLGHLSDKLLISRWQRDLSDSTVQRSLGTVFGHATIANESLLKGLGKVQANVARLEEDLASAWEVLAEPIQTVMRKKGIHDAYERLKTATRGQAVTKEALLDLINSVEELDSSEKDLLLNMTPAVYTGLAASLVRNELSKKQALKQRV